MDVIWENRNYRVKYGWSIVDMIFNSGHFKTLVVGIKVLIGFKSGNSEIYNLALSLDCESGDFEFTKISTRKYINRRILINILTNSEYSPNFGFCYQEFPAILKKDPNLNGILTLKSDRELLIPGNILSSHFANLEIEGRLMIFQLSEIKTIKLLNYND